MVPSLPCNVLSNMLVELFALCRYLSILLKNRFLTLFPSTFLVYKSFWLCLLSSCRASMVSYTILDLRPARSYVVQLVVLIGDPTVAIHLPTNKVEIDTLWVPGEFTLSLCKCSDKLWNESNTGMK